jgi:hypothetical protein
MCILSDVFIECHPIGRPKFMRNLSSSQLIAIAYSGALVEEENMEKA